MLCGEKFAKQFLLLSHFVKQFPLLSRPEPSLCPKWITRLLSAVTWPQRRPRRLCHPRCTPDRNLLALGHKGNFRLVRKSARPTCGAPRITSHCAITVASQGMFIVAAPTARSGYQDSRRPPAVLVLANGPSPFLSTSPRVSLPRRVVRHVRRRQPAMLRPPVAITEAPRQGGLQVRGGETKGSNLGRQGC